MHSYSADVRQYAAWCEQHAEAGIQRVEIPTEDDVEAAEDSWANLCAPSDIVEPAVEVVKVLKELFPDVVVITGSMGAPECKSGPSLANGRRLAAAVSPPRE